VAGGAGSARVIAITALTFLVLLVLAVPVAFSVGTAGFVGLWWNGSYPLTIIVQQAFLTVDSFVLLAIPLFILAGFLMETGGIAVRLVRFAQALVGWIRGGLAMRVVVAEYIFSGISGSTVADVSAIGATMIPPMTRAGYKPEQAVCVVAAASAMGILVPPCILMIVIGAIANVSVAALFVGGFLPALVLALAIMGYIYYDARRAGIETARAATPAELWSSLRAALIPLSRSSSSAASWRRVHADRGGGGGGVLCRGRRAVRLPRDQVERSAAHPDRQRGRHRQRLLAVAAVVAWMLAVAQVPARVLESMTAISAGPTVFLILTALLFIALGAVLEGLPAVIILLPTFLPVVKQLNIDLIHFSIVVVAATGIGLFLPPIGVGLSFPAASPGSAWTG
jgi:C4-dicarboxylate transporter DctM subunit